MFLSTRTHDQPPNSTQHRYNPRNSELQLTMSVVGDVELRRRNLRTSMPQSTEEFSGSTLQFFDRSPTATPAQTRSGSPTLGSPTPHTTAETTKFMSDLHAITGRDATPDTTNPTATMTSAGVIDGSVYVSTAMKMQYLAVYFFFNLGLTLYNKAVMIKVSLSTSLIVPLFPS